MKLFAALSLAIATTASAQTGPTDVQVTKDGIRFLNYEVAHLTMVPRQDTEIIQGTETIQWIWVSDCLDWQDPICYDSVIEVGLRCRQTYSFRMLTEALDRSDPMREEHFIEDWRWRPGDIDMNGVADMHDLLHFNDWPYDWNNDGASNITDVVELLQEITNPRICRRFIAVPWEAEKVEFDFAPVPIP